MLHYSSCDDGVYLMLYYGTYDDGVYLMLHYGTYDDGVYLMLHYRPCDDEGYYSLMLHCRVLVTGCTCLFGSPPTTAQRWRWWHRQ